MALLAILVPGAIWAQCAICTSEYECGSGPSGGDVCGSMSGDWCVVFNNGICRPGQTDDTEQAAQIDAAAALLAHMSIPTEMVTFQLDDGVVAVVGPRGDAVFVTCSEGFQRRVWLAEAIEAQRRRLSALTL